MLKLLGGLAEGGVFLFTAGGLEGEAEHFDAAMGPEVYYSTLGVPGLLAVIEKAGCQLRHLEFDQWPQKHLVVIVQRLAQPAHPLARLGGSEPAMDVAPRRRPA